MLSIKWSDIKEEIRVCPYCMSEANRTMETRGCCGESSDHFANAIVTNNNECYLVDEVEIIDDRTEAEKKLDAELVFSLRQAAVFGKVLDHLWGVK